MECQKLSLSQQQRGQNYHFSAPCMADSVMRRKRLPSRILGKWYEAEMEVLSPPPRRARTIRLRAREWKWNLRKAKEAVGRKTDAYFHVTLTDDFTFLPGFGSRHSLHCNCFEKSPSGMCELFTAEAMERWSNKIFFLLPPLPQNWVRDRSQLCFW